MSRRQLPPIVLAILIVVTGFSTRQVSAAELRVVASIKPIHSLVASVMAGVGVPELLLKGASSPHSFSLKPSDARALAKADVVFWVGPDMEVFLTRPVKNLAISAQIVELSRTPGLRLLSLGLDESGEIPEEANLHNHKNMDPHIWLNPDNAKLLVGEIVRKLGAADADNAEIYAANGAALIAMLNRLTTELDATLAEVRTAPFIVFHDAFQYFVKRFGLNANGAIILNPERTPGAGKINRIRKKIASGNIRCIFTEPQFNPAIVKSITRNTSTRISVLDPLGADISAGPAAYATLLRTLASALVSCLKR